MGRRKVFLSALLVLGLLYLSFSIGFIVGERQAPSTARNEFNVINEIWEALNKEYVDPKALDQEKLRAGAIKGMLEALNDPYTAYLSPHVYQMETADLAGKFQGIGAQVTLRDEQLIVIAPIPGSPADKAGIRAGDKILTVDGQATKGLSLPEAILKIRGPKETAVTLRITHEGETAPVDITIIRAEIELVSVNYEVKDGLGYLRITH
ncbi:MAG: PDZ domain-containing protein, partial [Chloroflexota bacterium]